MGSSVGWQPDVATCVRLRAVRVNARPIGAHGATFARYEIHTRCRAVELR
jgi:hypothetical protein